MSDSLLHLLRVVVMALAPALLALVVALVLRVLASIRETLDKKNVGKMIPLLSRIAHFAEIVVADLNATLKPELKAAVQDGVLTATETKKLRDLAIVRLKALLAEQGVKELQDVVGIAATEVDQYLGGVLERAVDRLKPHP